MTNEFNINGQTVKVETDVTDDNKHPKKPKVQGKPAVPYSRSFTLTTYIDTEAVNCFVARCPWVQHYALAYHDKDLWTAEDEKKNPKHKAGTLKEPHTHILLYTYSAKTSSAIIRNFDRFSREYYKGGTPQNTMCEIPEDVTVLWRYLTHKDDPQKYQYSDSIRKVDSLDYWQKYEKTDGMNDTRHNFGLAMFDDMCNGVSTREMILRYGKEYIYHAHHLKGAMLDHFREEALKTEYSEEVSRRVIFEIENCVAELTAEVRGQYTEAQCKMFAEMLTHSLNNLAVLSDKVIYIREVL